MTDKYIERIKRRLNIYYLYSILASPLMRVQLADQLESRFQKFVL